MTISQSETEEFRRAVAVSVRKHWVLFLVEGIALMLLGIAAIVVPPAATLATTLVLGWIFLFSGIFGLVTTFWARGAPGFWWSLLSAVLGIAAGALLLASPANGILSLTLVLIVFFAVEGVATIMFALDHRRELSGRWGWLLASGLVDLILAAVIAAGLPGTAVWAIGLLVGINMVFGGVALTAMALSGRSNGSSAVA